MSVLKRKKSKREKNKKSKDKEKKAKSEAIKKPAQKKRAISVRSRAFRILKNPLITEKGTELSSLNKYVFEVSSGANRIEVKKAVEELYGVTVLKVNMMNFQGKKRRYGRNIGRTRDFRKAIVTLRQGDTIQLFEGV